MCSLSEPRRVKLLPSRRAMLCKLVVLSSLVAGLLSPTATRLPLTSGPRKGRLRPFLSQMGMACAYEIDKGDGGKTDSALGRPDSSDYKIGDAPSADNDSPDAPANATCGGAQQGAARECTSGNSFELKPA